MSQPQHIYHYPRYPVICAAFSTGNPEKWREETCEYTFVVKLILNQSSPPGSSWESAPVTTMWSKPCVFAVATPETIWTASSRAKTHLWLTSSSRSTGKPNRRSSRSPGRKRTNMWWRQTQIWTLSWRSGGRSKCFTACWGTQGVERVVFGYRRPRSRHTDIKKQQRYAPSGGLCSD